MTEQTHFLRAFFAILAPKAIQDLAKDLQTHQELQVLNLRWLPPAQLHLTLKFLANIREDQLSELIETVSLQLKNRERFYLELGPLELFPSIARPKFLSLSMKSSIKCLDLVNQLNDILLAMAYPLETRPFRGHITLARFTESLRDKTGLQASFLPCQSTIHVNEFYLFESRPDASGSKYIPLASFTLA